RTCLRYAHGLTQCRLSEAVTLSNTAADLRVDEMHILGMADCNRGAASGAEEIWRDRREEANQVVKTERRDRTQESTGGEFTRRAVAAGGRRGAGDSRQPLPGGSRAGLSQAQPGCGRCGRAPAHRGA